MGATADPPLLDCSALVKRFGDRVAVDDVTFAVRAGETYGLLGPNGAGKTTTIRMICGLLAPDSGRMSIDGRLLDGDPALRRSIGLVPQDIALYGDLTARENLRFFGRLYRLGGRELDHRVDEVLELVGLLDRDDERVESFSGGMKRRLNIGVGLVHGPRLLVLDEPTVGVDPQSRHAILESVRDLGAAGMGILYTTHYMEEAERICDRIGVIDHGHLIAEGTNRELVSQVAEHDHVRLTATGDLPALAERCRALSGVVGATADGGRLDVVVDDGRRMLPKLLALTEESDVTVSSIEVDEPDLETVFLHLTGTALRE